ncbi:MAG: DUF748 domain-containing protein [Sphingobacteriales bacterium JAD_PAG50586_3]|nr:MAG: DUF748 domain-containing protein [Sphingobacteriales bacterium JAD_PAG50586_3]
MRANKPEKTTSIRAARRERLSKLSTDQRKGRSRRRLARTIVITLGVLAIINFALGPVLTWYVNKKMADMPEYVGHIDCITVNMITASARVDGFDMKKKNGQIPVPFVYINKIKAGLEWKSLFKGSIVAKIDVDSLNVNFVKGPTKEQSQTSVDTSWVELADDLMPISINKFELHRGEIHYRDFYQSPKVDIYANHIYVLAENLSNVKDSAVILPSKAVVRANVYGGSVNVKAQLDVLSKIPKFDVTAEIKKIPIPKLNDFARAYANIDVQKGYFSMYAEAASKDKKIKGYIKPFVEDLDVLNLKEEKEDPLKTKLYEGLIEIGSWFVENHKEDNIATRIEIEGNLDNPKISVWQIITDLLRNAFVKAFFQSIDNTVSINTIGETRDKTFLEKVFGSGDDRKQKKEDRKKEKELKKKERQEKKKK